MLKTLGIFGKGIAGRVEKIPAGFCYPPGN